MSKEIPTSAPRNSLARAQRIAEWLAAREQTHSSPHIPYQDLGQNMQGVVWVDHGNVRSQASHVTTPREPGFVIVTGHNGGAPELIIPPRSSRR